ncbi:MAG: amidohydrolase family protein [Pseudomonadota bacterium]
MRIDAHHHLWRVDRGDYDWMPKDNAILNRDYAPADLAPILRANGIDKAVIVQAAATVAETDHMLALADETDWIAGVVGWIDFEEPGQRAELERLAKHPKFKGLRPMIQDIPDNDWMLRDDLAWAYGALTDLGLRFDALGFPRHLDTFHTLLTRHPDMPTVIDHCMKPDVARQDIDRWAEGMARLARDTRAYVKLSGLVTEAAEHWAAEDLKPYVDHILEHFGPDRILWGSDWPVCRLRAEYDVWLGAAEALTAHLDEDARAAIFGGTAARFYGL